jgi:hypothetical protein
MTTDVERERADMLAALKAQHRALDILMAALVLSDPTFLPSKSVVWPLIMQGTDAIKKAEGRRHDEKLSPEVERLHAEIDALRTEVELWKDRHSRVAICPDCKGERRGPDGALCRRCGGCAQIFRSELRPGEKGAWE